jgi:hypothetical protein
MPMSNNREHSMAAGITVPTSDFRNRGFQGEGGRTPSGAGTGKEVQETTLCAS